MVKISDFANKYKNIKNETIEIIDIPRRDEKDMNNNAYNYNYNCTDI